ncbi:MAG: hypothetical protein LBV67_07000 [Streptococcaceae bacterium]|nr:hypothetical protein [Streptococcaceae bacterium]
MENYNKKAVELLKELCPDFEIYSKENKNSIIEHDRYRGRLSNRGKILRGYFYLKVSLDDINSLGLITGKSNIAKYELEQFSYNFETKKFNKLEKGWKDEKLIELLRYLKIRSEENSNNS